MRNYFWLIFFVLLSCRVQTVDEGIMIGTNEDYVSFTSFADSVCLLPLATNNQFLIGQIDKILDIDSVYFFLDAGKTKSIYKYGKSGEIYQKFQHIGRGPLEYIEIRDLAWDNDRLLILCFPGKIFITDMDLNIEKTIRVNEGFSRLACFNGKVYLYSHTGRGLHLLNIDTGSTENLLEEGDIAQLYFRPLPVFHKVEGHLLYVAVGSDDVYMLDSGKPQLLFTLNYQQKVQKKKRMNQFADKDVLTINPPYVFEIFTMGGNYAILYSYEAMIRLCIIDREKHKAIHDGIMSDFIGDIRVGYLNKQLFTWKFMPDRKFISDSSLYKIEMQTPFYNDDEANPVLIRYILKDSVSFKN